MSVIKFYDPKKEFGFMSNFYKSPIIIDSVKYPTVEHYFQVMKFEPVGISDIKLIESHRWFQKEILKHETAGKIKFLSRQKEGGPWAWHKPLSEVIKESKKRNVKMREDWEDVKIEIMTIGIVHKFLTNKKLLKELIKTKGKKLEEASPRDSFWGTHKKGKNWLGKILVCFRDIFIKFLNELP